MERVSKYIQDNYQRSITLSEIADIGSMTEQSFSRWFRQTWPYLYRLSYAIAHYCSHTSNKYK